MRKERYYLREGNITYTTCYIVMDGANDRKIAECFFKEDALLIIKSLNLLNRRIKQNG